MIINGLCGIMVNQVERADMPKKPRDHEPSVLRIEGLSGAGDRPKPETFADDFTGERIAKAGASAPSPEVATPDHRAVAQAARARAKVEGLSLLIKLGIAEGIDPIPAKPREIVPKGYRKIAEINGKAVLVPIDPIRRI